MKKKNAELNLVEKIDPTLPFTEIEIAGKKYKMCLDFGAIAKAEAELASQLDESLMLSSANLNMRNSAIMFAVSLRIYHPEIAFEDAKSMVNWENSLDVCLAIRDAQKNFMSEPDEAAKPADPPPAPES